jgi:hypothetical protein
LFDASDIVPFVERTSLATWLADKSHAIELPLVSVVALKLCAAVYSWAVLTTATLVPTVADPVLIVTSPVSVVVKFPIVPVVLLNVAIVPAVDVKAPPNVPPVALRVPIVPDVAITDVELVVPEDRFVIVPRVEVVVPAVRFGIVPFVICAPVLIDLLLVVVPELRTPVKLAFVYVPPVRASSNRLRTVVLLGASASVRLASAIMISSSVATLVRRV